MADDPELQLAVERDHDPELALFLEERLYEFNIAATGISDDELLVIRLRGADGEVVGGAFGWTWGGTCFLRHLFIPAGLRRRGLGTRIMRLIEAEAVARGCAQIVLDTHDFQAPAFYGRLGFSVIGTVDDYPRGHRHLTLRKRLGAAAGP
jgi:ribosomal protein S18 acetylase RimI-like enzyme